MTRYPKSGKGKKWTQLELKSISPDWRGDTLSDGDGLSGEVRVAVESSVVSVRFKYAFKRDKKVAWHQCGTWPTLTMEAIRANRDKARELIKAGINPNDHKKAERIERQAEVEATIAEAEQKLIDNLSFSAMFEAWLKDGVVRKDGNAEIIRSFSKDVLPAIGSKPVASITEHDLRALLRAIVSRGVNRMAVRVYHDIVQLFDWAEERKPWRQLMTEENPANLLEIEKIVSPDYDLTGERDRLLSTDELRELRSIFEEMERTYAQAPVGSKYEVARPLKKESQIAIWLCLSTLCRIGELLMSKWENVDLESGQWHIPIENVKGKLGKKKSHRISLSRYALEKFKELHELTGNTPFCFPSRNDEATHVCVKSVSKQIGDRQTQFKSRSGPLKNRRNDDSLVLGKGKNGEWTPHDMRRTGSTMMQALKISLDVIDRCQNHVLEGSHVRRHYLHHDYFEETRDAWSRLGENLEIIFAATSSDSGEEPAAATSR
ncbi:tyrosine-type recombinase/integrase [Polaromonas sp. UC242_47]|uniref:tyrosine-type recombinase/integrase n=1 Tax=Polaromonas sp. UC242_47 TaxID=3374626 RepID=UPI0037883B87